MRNEHDNKYLLTIQSDLCYLEEIERFLNEIFKMRNISLANFQKILLCVSEGVANAIIHGNGNNKEKSVRIEIVFDKLVCEVLIMDEGSGFDFENLPNPTNYENIRKEWGRGLYIIKSYASEVDFLKNGSVLKMKLCFDE